MVTYSQIKRKVVYTMLCTNHFENDRKTRIQFTNDVIGVGKIVDKFIVDRGHINGREIHNITDTGLIIIQNERTQKFVTVLIARPNQIKRYYVQNNRAIPTSIYKIAKKS